MLKSNLAGRNDTSCSEFSTFPQLQFCREKLPSAEVYYRLQGLNLIGGGMWRTALCPFHDDRNPSLRINMGRGGFCCMACGAKGGDVLDFHRKRYDMTFPEAVQALGAWRKT
jgi:DNA primase